MLGATGWFGCSGIDRRLALAQMALLVTAVLPSSISAELSLTRDKVPVLGMGNSYRGGANFAQTEIWGNKGTSQSGREFAAEAVRRLLRSRGVPTILQLNEAQQLLIQAWTTIACFSFYEDFPRAGGRAGWEEILRREVVNLQDATPSSSRASDSPTATSTPTRPSSDAYKVIEDVLLPALADRSASLLPPQALSEIESIAAGEQAVGLGIAFIQPPARVAGKPERLKVAQVLPGTSAQDAGVAYGDRLLSIDGVDVGGERGLEPAIAIQGPLGSTVRARFVRTKSAKGSTTVTAGRGERGCGVQGYTGSETYEYEAVLARQLMTADVVEFASLVPAASRAQEGQGALGEGGNAGASGGGVGDGGRKWGERVGYLRIFTFAGPPVNRPAMAEDRSMKS